MEIKKSLNRFLSIFLIVAMGVSFYSGIQASAPDMRATGDAYFDESSLMDLRVISTLGLTEEDLDALREVEGVKSAEGGYMTDELCQEAEEKKVLHIESILEEMNLLTPKEGRLPETASECFLDASYAAENGYQVGDTLKLSDNGMRKRALCAPGALPSAESATARPIFPLTGAVLLWETVLFRDFFMCRRKPLTRKYTAWPI